MNAVEKLEAAITKLEALRDASTKPTGAASWHQGRERKRYERHTEVYSGPDERTPGSQDIAWFSESEDAELVVVLHRTIDAQLVILRTAKYRRVHMPRGSGIPISDELALADAILGVSDADVG